MLPDCLVFRTDAWQFTRQFWTTMQQIDWSLKIIQIFSNLLIDIINLPRKRIPIFVIFVINSESNFVFPRRNEFNKFNLELLFVDFLQSMSLFCLCQFRLVRTWCIFNIFKNMFLSLSHNDKREHIESKFSLYEQISMKQLSKYMI